MEPLRQFVGDEAQSASPSPVIEAGAGGIHSTVITET
jgi:hypothetical protein